MARAKTSPAARLEALKKVKPRLRKFKRGETVSAMPMAEFLGVTWQVLRSWCDDYPQLESDKAFVRGGNGIEWVFDPRKVVKGLIAEFDGQLKAARAKSARVRKIVAGDKADQFPEDFSLDDMRKQLALSAQLRIEREAHGELVNAGTVRETLNRTFSDMRDAGLRTLQKMDPNGRWTGEQRKFAQDIVTGILVEQEQAAQKSLKDLHGGAA